jgi:hypothetical protein
MMVLGIKTKDEKEKIKETRTTKDREKPRRTIRKTKKGLTFPSISDAISDILGSKGNWIALEAPLKGLLLEFSRKSKGELRQNTNGVFPYSVSFLTGPNVIGGFPSPKLGFQGLSNWWEAVQKGATWRGSKAEKVTEEKEPFLF